MLRGGICDSRCQAFYTAMIEKEESMRMRWFLKNQQKLLEHLEKTKPAKKIELSPIRKPERKEPSVDIIRLKPLPNWRPMEPDGSVNINIMKPIDPKVRAILYEDEPSFITAENYLHESWEAEIAAGGTVFEKYEAINDMTFKRFEQARENFEQVTTSTLQQWAVTYARELNCDRFVASASWIFKFKRKYGIRQKKITRWKDMPEDRHFYPDCTSWVYGWRLTDYPPTPKSKVGRTSLVMNEFYHPWCSSLRTDPDWYRPPQTLQSVCRDDEY